MSRRPLQCNLAKCTFADVPHRYHPGHRVPARLELADDPDDLAVPVFDEQAKRRKPNGTSTRNQHASAPPAGSSVPPRAASSVSTQAAVQPEIQVGNASGITGSADTASDQAGLDEHSGTALALALRNWSGAIVLITHDRWLSRVVVEGESLRVASGVEDSELSDGEDSEDTDDEGGTKVGATWRVGNGKIKLMEKGMQGYVAMVERKVAKQVGV